jgi:hypothetical protein
MDFCGHVEASDSIETAIFLANEMPINLSISYFII